MLLLLLTYIALALSCTIFSKLWNRGRYLIAALFIRLLLWPSLAIGQTRLLPWNWKRATYQLSVLNGTGSGKYRAGAVVKIQATLPPGKTFAGWRVVEGTLVYLSDGELPTAGVTMPTNNVTIMAVPSGSDGPPTQRAPLEGLDWNPDGSTRTLIPPPGR